MPRQLRNQVYADAARRALDPASVVRESEVGRKAGRKAGRTGAAKALDPTSVVRESELQRGRFAQQKALDPGSVVRESELLRQVLAMLEELSEAGKAKELATAFDENRLDKLSEQRDAIMQALPAEEPPPAASLEDAIRAGANMGLGSVRPTEVGVGAQGALRRLLERGTY